jgi:hypothetical protein
MAETTREQAKSHRAKSRERRRSLASQPSEELNEAASEGADDSSDTIATAKRAARTAAGAAIAGGLAGAAKALLDRRSHPDDGNDEEHDADDEEPKEQRAAANDAVSSDRGPEQDAARAGPADPPTAHEPPRDRDAEAEPDERNERDEPPEPQRGAPSSDVAAMVKRAREQITDLLGKEPESVSGVQHANGSWSVTVEVVEIYRIPDTTDILSSYEVVLDDEGDLVRLNRQRRYRRSQVEEDG